MQEDIIIRIKQVLEGNSLPVARAMFRQLKEEMDNTNRSTKEGEARYKALSVAAGNLNTHIRGLSREQKGLSYEITKSKEQHASFMAHITMVAAGIVGAYKLMSDAGKKAFDIMLKGAEFGVLYDNYIKLSGGVENASMKLDLFDKALAGNLSDDKIMRMSNSFEALNYSTLQQAQMFNFIEDASDAFNITIEEGESKLTRYFETGKDKGATLRKIGIDTRAVNDAVDNYAKSIGTTTAKLGEEATAQLRARFTMEMFGKSLDEIKNKQKDNADKLTSLTVAYDNFSKQFGKSMSDMALGNKTIAITSQNTKDLGSSLGSLVGFLVSATATSLKYVTVLGWWYTVIGKIKEKLQDFGIINKPASDKYTAEVIDPKKEAEINKVVQDRTIKLERDKRIREDALKIQKEQNLTEEKALELAVRKEMGLDNKMPKTGTSSKGSIKNLEETKKILLEIDKLENTLADLKAEQNEYITRGLTGLASYQELLDKIAIAERKINYEKGLTGLGTVTGGISGDITPEGRNLTTYEKDLTRYNKIIEEEKLQSQERINDSMSQGLSLSQQIADVLGIGADNFVVKFLSGFKQGLDLANSFASFLSMIFNIGSGGASGGIFSLLGLAGGTDNWGGGWALVGDDNGKPTRYSELAYLAPGSKVIPNKPSMNLLSMVNYKPLSSGTGDLNRYMSGGGSNTILKPNILVVVKSELEKTKAVKTIYDIQGDLNKFINDKNVD